MKILPLSLSLVMGALMITSSAVAYKITPKEKIADTQAKFQLGALVPSQFGDWHVDTSIVPLQVDPETQAKLDKIYNQTLARTYINRDGERIMLSIAYGGDQSDNMSVHKPEVCYVAQGFNVDGESMAQLSTSFGNIPVKRLFAVQGNRNEPITYWITVGDKAIAPGIQQKLQQLRYGLTGTIPDGMLVRVSSIGSDRPSAYSLQDGFVQQMLSSMDPVARTRLAGILNQSK